MRVIIGVLLNFILMLPALAQENHKEKWERIEALKVSYITQKLDLTTEEAQRFWPVYNEYQKQVSALWRKKKQVQRENKDNPQEALNKDLDYDAQILNIKKKYRKELTKVLPPDKVLALTQAEREFRERLIKELGRKKKD